MLDTLVLGYAGLPTSLKSFSWNTRRIASVTATPYPAGTFPLMVNWMLSNLQLQHLHLGPAVTEFAESSTDKFQWGLGANIQSLSIPYFPNVNADAFSGLDGASSLVISILDPTYLYQKLSAVKELTIVPVSASFTPSVSLWTPFKVPSSIVDLSISLPLVTTLDVDITSVDATFRLNTENLGQPLVNLQVIWNSENITFQTSTGLGFSLDVPMTGTLDLDLSHWAPASGVHAFWHSASSFPDALTTFSLHTPVADWTVPTAFFSASLVNADFYGHPLSSFGSATQVLASLQRLTFNNYPDTEVGFNAQFFGNLSCNVLPLYTSLKELRFHEVTVELSTALFQGCFDLPRYAALTTFELTTSSPFVNVEPYNLPAHVSDFTFVYTNSDQVSCPLDLSAVLIKFGSYVPSPLRKLTISGVTDPSTFILSLPSAFPDLQYIDLSYNSITSTLPDTWFDSFTNLSYIDLSNNGLSGSIPTMALKENIQYFNMSYNFFNDWALDSNSGGVLTNKLAYAFTEVDVSFNKLKTIPTDEAFDLMTSAISIDVSSNYLDIRGYQNPRALPVFWVNADFTQLRKVNLSNSVFNGDLPPTFATGTTLEVLDLSNNQITGTIPEVEGYDIYFELLDVSENEIASELPATFNQLHINAELNLALNSFTGSVKAPGRPVGWPAVLNSVSSSQQAFGGNAVAYSARALLPKYGLGESSELRLLAVHLENNTFSGGLPLNINFAAPALPAIANRYELGFINLESSGIDYCAADFDASYVVPAEIVCVANLSICACREKLLSFCDWSILDPICSEAFPMAPVEAVPVADPTAAPVETIPVESPVETPSAEPTPVSVPEELPVPLPPLETPVAPTPIEAPVVAEPMDSPIPVEVIPTDEPSPTAEPSPVAEPTDEVVPTPVEVTPVEAVPAPVDPNNGGGVVDGGV